MSKPKKVFCSNCGTMTNVINKNDIECNCKKCNKVIKTRMVSTHNNKAHKLYMSDISWY